MEMFTKAKLQIKFPSNIEDKIRFKIYYDRDKEITLGN
jgi:hypothetical protein